MHHFDTSSLINKVKSKCCGIKDLVRLPKNISSLQPRIWIHSVKNILERLLKKYEKKQLEKLYRLTRIIG